MYVIQKHPQIPAYQLLQKNKHLCDQFETNVIIVTNP